MKTRNTGADRARASNKSSLRQVTPLSKTLAMILFIGLPFIGGWVGYAYAPTKVVEVTRLVPVVATSTTPETEQIVTRPHDWYEDEMERFAAATSTVTFTGAFMEDEMTAWDTTMTCRQLILRNYPQNELHEYYAIKALSGNTVQRFADHGLLLNLPWEEIPAVDQERIQQGTAQDPVSVRLQKKPEIGRGVGPCYSFFEYRGIEE